MIMKRYLLTSCKIGQLSLLTFILMALACTSSFAQISFNDDSKPDSRKIRREMAKYDAEDVKDSHLKVQKASFKKGEAAPRPLTEEMEESVIYYGPNPVKAEKNQNKRKR